MNQLIPSFLVLLALLLQHVRSASDSVIEERQSIVGDLSFCYGQGAICDVENQLWQQCETYEQPYQPVKWFQCVCGNGYVSVEEACYDCEMAYNLSVLYNGPENRRGCSSIGVPVAPIPSGILAMESAYNKTYTGTLITQSSGATTAGGNTGAATTANPVTSSTVQPGPSITATNPSATGSIPHIGGASVTTLQGGAQGTLGNSPTTSSTTAARAASTGGSAPVLRRNGGTAALLSLFTFLMSNVYLI